jgi:hypothetical protein
MSHQLSLSIYLVVNHDHYHRFFFFKRFSSLSPDHLFLCTLKRYLGRLQFFQLKSSYRFILNCLADLNEMNLGIKTSHLYCTYSLAMKCKWRPILSANFRGFFPSTHQQTTPWHLTISYTVCWKFNCVYTAKIYRTNLEFL